MPIDIKQHYPVQAPIASEGGNGTSARVSSKQINIDFNKKPELEQLIKQLNITKDMLVQILARNPGFLNMSEIEQRNFIAKTFSQTEEPVDPSINQELPHGEKSENFDFKNYFTKSHKEQFDIYATELAKNKFLHGNPPKTEAEWKALGDGQIQLINAEKASVNKAEKSGTYSKDGLEYFFQQRMIALQTANEKGMSIDQFNALSEKQKAELKHDYIFNMPEESLSESLQKYLNEQELMSAAVIDACRKNGEDWGNGEYILNSYELKEHAQHLGKSLIEIQYDYLKGKAEKGIISDDEKARLEGLDKIINTPAGKQILEYLDNPQNYGRMDELKNSSFGQDWENVQTASSEDKIMILDNYIKEKCKNLSPEDKATFMNELISELAADDPLLANGLAGLCLKGLSAKEQKAFINNDTGLAQEFSAINVNELTPEMQPYLAEHQKAMRKENPDRANALACTVLKVADEQGLLSTSKIYSGFGSKEVEDAHVNASYDEQRVGAKTQKTMQTNTYNYSNDETAKAAAIRIDEAYKENQVDLTRTAVRRKVVANAMNENGTMTRCDKDNQTEMFRIFKNRFEQDDYSKDEAITQLNTLSDQIQNCDKDNQLDMHNEIMGSKYSEVQEHAAGNIKNYDSSVQEKAMDSVYKSGNQKAIDKAVENMTSYKSDDVKKQELGRVFGEHCAQIADEKDLKERFLGGELTLQEISQLPASKRREYYVNLFKKATPAQKLAWLSKMPDGTQKKTVYTFIALYDSNLLNSMIENGKGLEMFNICSDVAAKNKIFTIMKRSETPEVQDQCEQIKNNPRNASFFTGQSEPKITENPRNPEEYDIYKKDKSGILLG